MKGSSAHKSIFDDSSRAVFRGRIVVAQYAQLPNADQIEYWRNDITYHTLIHEDFKVLLEGFPSNSHPMGVLSSLAATFVENFPSIA